MSEGPGTAYVETANGGSVAYQVVGDGPIDLFVRGGAPVPLDLYWEQPDLVRIRNRLGRFSRTVWLEPLGFGLSDRDIDPESAANADETHAQVTAVADALRTERFALMTFSINGPWAIRYTANHPERVTALILVQSFASYVQDGACPWGFPRDFLDQVPEFMAEMWGTGASLDVTAPSRRNDERLRAWVARGERLAGNPARAGRILKAVLMQDARDCLDAVRVPTLVIHRRDDAYIRVEAGRYMAEHIDNVRYVELPGADAEFWVGDYDAILDEIEEFLTGARSSPEGDLATATILFTDIVASTEQSARLGHRKWTALVDAHDAMVRATLGRYRGREVKTIGDGFLATFDATTRAVRAAMEIVTHANDIGIKVRAGVHTGDVEIRPDDVVGLAVTIAKRVCDLADPAQVLVSETTKGQLVGSGITTDHRGTHLLKGVPDEWQLFAVSVATPSSPTP